MDLPSQLGGIQIGTYAQFIINTFLVMFTIPTEV